MTTAPTPTTIVGIDPGGRDTGIAAVAGRTFLGAAVITRHKENRISDHDHGLTTWRAQVIRQVAVMVAAAVDPRVELDLTDDVARGWLPAGTLLAVETFRRPNPHQRRADGNSLTNPDGILATAYIVGAIAELWADTGRLVLVPPGGNGSNTPDAYPEELRPPVNVTRTGPPADRLRHARSAYDVALSAAFLARTAPAANYYPNLWPARTTTVTARR